MSDVLTALQDALDPSTQRPCLAPDVELARFPSRWQGPHAVLHNPRRHTYIRLGDAEADLVERMDGSHTVADLTVASIEDGGLDPELVADLVGFLHRGGFLTRPWVDTYGLLATRTSPPSTRLLDRIWRRMKTMTVEFPGAQRFIDAVYDRGGRRAFAPAPVVVMTAVLVAGLVAFAVEVGSDDYTLLGEPTAWAAVTLFALGHVALVFHELGHALAIRHAGRRILGAGFQLYLANPVFFIDSSDMVMAGRWARARNAAAGPFAEGVVASAAALLALPLGDSGAGEILFRFAGLCYVFTLINLVPFLELDGYWLMTDVLDTPDLRPRALSFLRHDFVDALRTRRPLSRGEWGLALFGLIGAAFTVIALLVGWALWWPILRAFTSGLWDAGIGGRIGLVLLAVLVVGPIVHGLGDAVRALRRWVERRVEAARFRAERGWRIEAGEMIAALPHVADLFPEDLNDVAGRVRRRRVSAGEAVVRQGDTPDAFYLMRRGRCAVVEEDDDGVESVIAHLGRGDTFGELALLEGTPRSATVRAETNGEVFAVDGPTFQRILAGSLSRPGLAPAAWPVTRVWSLPPFRKLGLAAAAQLTEAGEWLRVAPGEDVVRKGESGDAFYVVANGQLEARGRGNKPIGGLRAGDFFGEVALLLDAPRTATVTSLTPARLFKLPRAAFDDLVRGAFETGELATFPSAQTHSTRAPRSA